MSKFETLTLNFVDVGAGNTVSPLEDDTQVTVIATSKTHAEAVLTEFFKKTVKIETSKGSFGIGNYNSVVYIGKEDFYFAKLSWGVLIETRMGAYVD